MRTRKEIEAEASATQRAHRRAEAAAILLLFRARNSVAVATLPLLAAADMMSRRVRDAIVIARQGSQERGVARLIAEAASADVMIGPVGALAHVTLATDWRRADYLGRSYANRWASKAEQLDDARAALRETSGSLDRIAVSESSQAFSAGRTAAAEDAVVRWRGSAASDDVDAESATLLKIWNAESDACPICEEVDGEIVGITESFSLGEPGSPHPHCRCVWDLLTMSEARGVLNIRKV